MPRAAKPGTPRSKEAETRSRIRAQTETSHHWILPPWLTAGGISRSHIEDPLPPAQGSIVEKLIDWVSDRRICFDAGHSQGGKRDRQAPRTIESSADSDPQILFSFGILTYLTTRSPLMKAYGYTRETSISTCLKDCSRVPAQTGLYSMSSIAKEK